MDISIIIVSWNTRDLLKKCLESIYARTRGTSFEIFVIDNGSRDKTIETVRQEFPDVITVSNTENRGFAGANNQGIRKAKGRYVLLLNPDTELKNNALLGMANFMDKKSPVCGVAGCHLLNADLSHQNSVRRFPGVLDQVIILLKLHRLFPGLAPISFYLASDFDYSKETSVDQVMGAFFMIRRETLEKVGMLDERNFFNWFEEVDFCRRARECGYEIWYTPSAEVIHHYGQSFRQVMLFAKQRMWNRSLRRYFRKHHSVIEYSVIASVSWIALGMVWCMDLVKRILAPRQPTASPMSPKSVLPSP
ncbi:MAG: glycosyltransferase family 2 protein [Candidatus Jacksonbacteria bacterium]|nr:glycosyltransferase family 2 protein [Candidatus Jacksonbacteria bacterium]